MFILQICNIKISTIIPSDYPWNGVYHGGCPIDIEAIPDSGYSFSHWENNNATANNLNNEKLENINLDANYTFTANFTSCDIAIEVTLEQRNNIIIPNITEYSGDILYQWYANGQLVSSDSIITTLQMVYTSFM